MKKFLLLLTIFISTQAFSQVLQFRTTAYSQRYVNSYGYWTDWSTYQKSNMLVIFDLNKDIIKIYSPKIQTYLILEYIETFIDSYGGKQSEWLCIDQDYDKGHIRLREDKYGNFQLYVDFSNVSWVYNLQK